MFIVAMRNGLITLHQQFDCFVPICLVFRIVSLFLLCTLMFVSSMLQIPLASSKRRGLTVELKLEMFLQVREDSPSRCSGTIRYISVGIKTTQAHAAFSGSY